MLEEILHIAEHSLLDTLPVIPVLFLIYFLMEYFWHKKALDLLSFLRMSGKYGVVVATLFGLIPQCGMSVFFTGLYLGKRITIGALIANYLATSDEAIPVMLSHLNYGSAIGSIIGIKVLLGISAGYIIDALVSNKYFSGNPVEESKKDLVHVGMEKTGSEIKKMFKHSISRTLQIAGWVFGATFLLGIVIEFSRGANPLMALNAYPLAEIPAAALFGLIPNCAASIAIATGYIQSDLSFSAAVAGLSAGAGFGPIILFRQGKLSDSVRVLIYTLLASLTAGYIVHFIF